MIVTNTKGLHPVQVEALNLIRLQPRTLDELMLEMGYTSLDKVNRMRSTLERLCIRGLIQKREGKYLTTKTA